jgi:hypothetical protein
MPTPTQYFGWIAGGAPEEWTPESLPGLALFNWFIPDHCSGTVGGNLNQASPLFGTTKAGLAPFENEPTLTADGMQCNGGTSVTGEYMTIDGGITLGDYCTIYAVFSEDPIENCVTLLGNTGDGSTTGLAIIGEFGGVQVLTDSGASGAGADQPAGAGLNTYAFRRNDRNSVARITGQTSLYPAYFGYPDETFTFTTIGASPAYSAGTTSGARIVLLAICTSYIAEDSADDLAMRAWLQAQGYPDL